jgi:TonB family protein
MGTYLEYLTKSSLWIIAFYAVYKFFLQKESFHFIKRLYLFLGMIASIIMPFWVIHYTTNLGKNIPSMQVGNGIATFAYSTLNMSPKIFMIETVASIIYCAVVLFLVSKTIIGLIKIRIIILKNKKKTNNIISTDLTNTPFSLGKYIILPKNIDSEIERKLIIQHEMVHTKELHYIDLWLSKLLCIVHFYNPFIWLYSRAMQTNCEFIADNRIFEHTDHKREYINLLVKYSIEKASFPISLHFSYSLTLKRIKTMKQKKSTRLSLAKNLIIVPLAGLILVGYAQPKNNNPNKSETTVIANDGNTSQQGNSIKTPSDDVIFTIVEQMPQFPGGGKALNEYLSENIRYPIEAQKAKTQGMVICQFIIEPNGKISNVTIVRSIDKYLDNEVIRLIESMPNWQPGIQRGIPVRVKYTLPVNFKL